MYDDELVIFQTGDTVKGEFIAILVAVLWGISPIIEKKALNHIEPSSAVFLRIMMDFAFISIIFLTAGKLNTNALFSNIKPIIYLAIVSLLAGVTAQYLFYRALEASTPSRVVVITSMYPLITILTTIVLSRSIPSAKVIFGAFLVFIGVFLVVNA